MDQLIEKTLEWNVPVWIVSIDLRKAFDRVEQNRLFEALSSQGVEDGYIALLRLLYSGQRGVVSDGLTFDINRGVRQGDVLSPLLFNAVLEQALRLWKRSLSSHGFALVPSSSAERLTNVRYADDILLLAKSLPEALQMLESIAAILKTFGLDLNASKTRILTSEWPDQYHVVETACGPVEILHDKGHHKYLGRRFQGNLHERGKCAVEHRLGCAWTKFRHLQKSLLDKHVALPLRLRLFEAAIAPTLTYSLETVALTQKLKDRVDVVQRRMLRRIVGWTRLDDESWHQTGSRMKAKLEQAFKILKFQSWSGQIQKAKMSLFTCMKDALLFTRLIFSFDLPACARFNFHSPLRLRGRPHTRWNDDLQHVN